MASFFGGSLRLALKQSLAETGHLATQQKEKEKYQREEADRKRKDRRKKLKSRQQQQQSFPPKSETKRRQQPSITSSSSRKTAKKVTPEHHVESSKDEGVVENVPRTKIHISTSHGKSSGETNTAERRSISSSSLSSSQSSASDSDDTESSDSDSNDEMSSSSEDTQFGNASMSSNDDTICTSEKEMDDGLEDTEDDEDDVDNDNQKNESRSNKLTKTWEKAKSEPKAKSHEKSQPIKSRNKKRKRDGEEPTTSSATSHRKSAPLKIKKKHSPPEPSEPPDFRVGTTPHAHKPPKATKRAKARFVADPSPEITSWIRSMSHTKQRKYISVGHRVKVRFVTENSQKGGTKSRKLKWYGGLVTEVLTSGRRIRILYDDGTSELANFPDKDIVVDAYDNGEHEASIDAFVPPTMAEESSHRAVSPLTSASVERERQKAKRVKAKKVRKSTPTNCENAESPIRNTQSSSQTSSLTSNKASTVTESSFSLPSSGGSTGINDSSESSCSDHSLDDARLNSLDNGNAYDERKGLGEEIGTKSTHGTAPTLTIKIIPPKASKEPKEQEETERNDVSQTSKQKNEIVNDKPPRKVKCVKVSLGKKRKLPISDSSSHTNEGEQDVECDPNSTDTGSRASTECEWDDADMIRRGDCEEEEDKKEEEGSVDCQVGEEAALPSHPLDNTIPAKPKINIFSKGLSVTAKKADTTDPFSPDSLPTTTLRKIKKKQKNLFELSSSSDSDDSCSKNPPLPAQLSIDTSKCTEFSIAQESQQSPHSQPPVTTSQSEARESENEQLSQNDLQIPPQYANSPSLKEINCLPDSISSSIDYPDAPSVETKTLEDDQALMGIKLASSRSTRRAALKANERIVAKEVILVDEYSIPKKKPKQQPDVIQALPDDEKSIDDDNGPSSTDENAKHVPEDNQHNNVEEGEERWVQCDRCLKWRLLPSEVEMETLPERWYCELNIYDSERNSCDAPEQQTGEEGGEKIVEVYMGGGNVVENTQEEEREVVTVIKEKNDKIEDSEMAVATIVLPESSKVAKTNSKTKHKTLEDEQRQPARPLREIPSDDDTILSVKIDSAEPPTEPLDPPSLRLSPPSHAPDTTDTKANKHSTRNNRPKTNKTAAAAKTKTPTASTTIENQEWVQCEKCEKWRKLPPCILSSSLPDIWYCSMNTWDVNSAFCEAEEDHVETTLKLNDKDVHPPTIKLSYRQLIFGSGKKFARPLSERARTADSLFARVVEGGPPVVSYATCSAFCAKGCKGKLMESGGVENRDRKRLLEAMGASQLWSELYGDNHGPQRKRLISSTTKMEDDFREANLMKDEKQLGVLVKKVVGSKILTACDVLLECKNEGRTDTEIDTSDHPKKRTNLNLGAIILVLDKLVKNGYLEIVDDSYPIRYRRCNKHIAIKENSSSNQQQNPPKFMKLSKPWKTNAFSDKIGCGSSNDIKYKKPPFEALEIRQLETHS